MLAVAAPDANICTLPVHNAACKIANQILLQLYGVSCPSIWDTLRAIALNVKSVYLPHRSGSGVNSNFTVEAGTVDRAERSN